MEKKILYFFILKIKYNRFSCINYINSSKINFLNKMLGQLKSTKKVFFLFLNVLIFIPLFSQDTIRGKLIDNKDNSPLMFANVSMINVSDSAFLYGTITDENGIFKIRKSTKQTFLRITAVGYQSTVVQLENAKQNGPYYDIGTIGINTEATLLNEVQVVAQKPLFSMDGEKNIYNTSDDPSIQSGTLSDALQNAPSIEVDANGNITLRGKQSVEIWINDKPSRLNGESLKQYIKTLPANSIKRIEVISNPSAKYGSGTPVVNIITASKIKRNEFLSFGVNANSIPSYVPWISYVYSNDKINFSVYTTASHSARKGKNSSSSIMLNNDKDTSQINFTKGESDTKSWNGYFGGNFDYTIDKKNSISAWMGIYPNWSKYDNYSYSNRQELLYNPGNYEHYMHYWKNSYSNPNTGFYYGVWYTHKFNDSTGHQISIYYDGTGNNAKSKDYFKREYSYQADQNIECRNTSMSSSRYYDFGFNYVLPFGRKNDKTGSFCNELELGSWIMYGKDHSENRYDTLDINVTNSMYDYCGWLSTDNDNNNIEAKAFVTYLHRFGRFTVKTGLNMNYMHDEIVYNNIKGFDLTKNNLIFTPTIHLSYSTENMNNFAFSWTHRTSTISANMLTTYITYYLDNYSTGNPLLKSSYTDNIETSWDKYFNKFGSIGLRLYYTGNRRQVGTLSDIVYSDFYGRMVSYSKPINIGSSYNTGINANISYRPSAFMNLRLGTYAYYDYIEMEYREGYRFQNEMWSYSLRANLWVKVWKWLQVFVNASYRSPVQQLFTKQYSNKSVDIGLNADFLDNCLSFNLSINDVFNSLSNDFTSLNPYYISNSTNKMTSRFIRFGAVFRFGKMELQSMARQGGSVPNMSGM